jgi:L-threonylcarbamoyladenylate synthase
LILPIDDPIAIPTALEILRDGGLVAFPTDTVYGVGALPRHPQAIARLYEVKGRSQEKAIPILLGEAAEMDQIAVSVSEMAYRLARHFWPGPLTLVVPKHASLPEEISSTSTVGVRMPDHPATLALLHQTGPLAVTSANLSGNPSCVTARQVLEQIGGRFPLLLDGGRAPGGISSTVVDCTGLQPRILRQGPISLAEIEEVLGSKDPRESGEG